MTVSNVVLGKSHLMRLDTRKRVEESIARLNYRPNLSARSLRLSQQHSVGIVIADNDPAFLTDPFISRLVSGLSNYLSSRDYTLDVQGVAPERFKNATILRKSGNDALCAILCGPRELRKAQVEHLQKLGPPIVVFQEAFDSRASNLTLVRQDDFTGGRLLGKHLMKTNRCRSLLFVRPMLEWYALEQREKGLRAAFAETSKRTEFTTLVAPSEAFEDVQRVVREYLANRVPDAIAAATDSMAVAAMKACEANGLQVPRDIVITGFNGFDVWRYTRPTLTTVRSPAYEMGRYAGELLIEGLKSSGFSKRNTVFPVTLQIGESA